MGQIVKRKKKGRPSKADLARRDGRSPVKAEPDVRRSLRRRNVKYNIDYDDYLDEDDEDDEEDQRSRQKQKKLKLVVKLNQISTDGDDSGPSHPRSESRGDHAHVSEDEESEHKGTVKKRKPSCNDAEDDGIKNNYKAVDDDTVEAGDYDDDNREDNNGISEQQQEVKARKLESKGLHPVPGTPPNPPSGIMLPDKKTLELILDKLQKKDTYGVYAEPVDPEELPDYHEVIEHPMDFSTVRKKLANGSYSTFEQFEDDIFLICSNAMQYNAADTIYHKQAHSIQELARKKFQRIRLDFERSDKDAKSDQKTRSTPLSKMPLKKPVYHTSQEPVSSDFSSGATLATLGEVLHGPNLIQFGSCEQPINHAGLLEDSKSLTDANAEKPEDALLVSGKSLLNKLGKKTVAHEDERRATYNLYNQPIVRSESVFTMLEGELKQLVAVGLHAEFSYARSLARFAATLGPVAWKIASQRIRQALPAGVKFGCGWIGEYEPPPTPALVFRIRSQQHSSVITGLQSTAEQRNGEKICQTQFLSQQPSGPVELRNGEQLGQTHVPAQQHTVKGLPLERQRPSNGPTSGIMSEAKPSFFDSSGTRSDGPVNNLHQSFHPRIFNKPEPAGSKQVELNPMPSANNVNTNFVAKFSSNMANSVSMSRELLARSTTGLQSAPFKPPDTSDAASNQRGRAITYSSNGQEQGLSDPVQMMKILSEKAKKQQDSSNHSQVDTGTTTPVPSGRRDESNNAAAAAARAWMSIGAGGFTQGSDGSSSPRNQISAESLYNPSRDFHPHTSKIRGDILPGGPPLQSNKKGFPFQAFVPQPFRVGSEAQFRNGPVMFPQLAGNDLSRFNMQPPRRGHNSPQNQPKQKQETLPPDLNVDFQSAGSPVRQSSGVFVESQQPDLALQL